MIYAIKDYETNYPYNHKLVTFEQHHHVHNVDTNRHSISNLYRSDMYGIFT